VIAADGEQSESEAEHTDAAIVLSDHTPITDILSGLRMMTFPRRSRHN
jgi:hypothetical protein